MKSNTIYLIVFFLESIFISCNNFTDLVKKNEKAVFSIYTYDEDGNLNATATGFFIDDKGTGITNFHVLGDAAKAKIKLSNGRTYKIDKVLAYNSTCDLIKFSIIISDDTVFSYLTFSSSLPAKGEKIFVIGNPEGLESTVSEGIVSSIRESNDFIHVIQITAPISHGSSGSPIMAMDGNVVGIASFDYSEGQNLNFGIESKNILRLKNRSHPKVLDSLYLFSWKPIRKDLKKENLKGRVKSITEYDYTTSTSNKFDFSQRKTVLKDRVISEYDYNGNKIEEAHYEADGSLEDESFYDEYGNVIGKNEDKDKVVYDEKGNAIEEDNYNADGSVKEKIIMKYDENGNLKEEDNYKSDGSLVSMSIFKYDENGNVKEFHEYNADRTISCIGQYDKNGNQVETDNYNVDGSLSCIWKCDEYGNDKEIDNYNADGTLYDKLLNKYDTNEKKIEEARYKANGSLENESFYDEYENETEYDDYRGGGLNYKTIYRYDEIGNLSEEQNYDYLSNGRLLDISVREYKYLFDNSENWIKKIELSEEGEEQGRTERKIEYY